MKRFLFAVAFCAVAAALAAEQAPMGQQGNPAKQTGTVLKGKAPVSKDVLKVSLPKSQEADLSNGIHLIVVEDHRAPQVFFTLLVDGAGGYYDPQASPGLATFTAADVQRVAKKYLTKENRSVVITLPKAAPAKGGAK